MTEHPLFSNTIMCFMENVTEENLVFHSICLKFLFFFDESVWHGKHENRENLEISNLKPT